jgi:hypothetical protein
MSNNIYNIYQALELLIIKIETIFLNKNYVKQSV